MSLFIGNITEAACKDDLVQEFSKFGRCEVEYFKKFAFCNFKNKVDAAEAMKHWNARDFKGNILKVEFSQRKNDNQASQTPSPEPKTRFEPLKKQKIEELVKNTKIEENKFEKAAQFTVVLNTTDESHLNESLKNESQETPKFISVINENQLIAPIQTKNFDEKVLKIPPNSPFLEDLSKTTKLKDLEIPILQLDHNPTFQKIVLEKVESIESPHNVYDLFDENTISYKETLFRIVKRYKDMKKTKVQCQVCSRVIQIKSIHSHLKAIIHASQSILSNNN